MSGQTIRQLLIFAGIQLAISLALFPNQFGMDLADIALESVALEAVFYGTMVYLLIRPDSMGAVVKSAMFCLVYRFGLSAIFGLVVTILYPMSLGNALQLGFGGYIPGLLLMAIPTPFILRSYLTEAYSAPRRRFSEESTFAHEREQEKDGRTTLVFSREAASKSLAPVQSHHEPAGHTSTSHHNSHERMTDTFYHSGSSNSDMNGFERAARYVCEDWSIYLAAVVDNEGLMLAHCKRGTIDPEQWSPFALELLNQNDFVMHRGGWRSPEKIDLLLPEERVVIARVDENTALMVVAERQNDDVLHIRISQAIEMIRKYSSERYGYKPEPNAEKYHVPSA